MQNQSPKMISELFRGSQKHRTYRTHQVPEMAPPVGSHQMPHKHLYPKTTSETRTGYSLTHLNGVTAD